MAEWNDWLVDMISLEWLAERVRPRCTDYSGMRLVWLWRANGVVLEWWWSLVGGFCGYGWCANGVVDCTLFAHIISYALKQCK